MSVYRSSVSSLFASLALITAACGLTYSRSADDGGGGEVKRIRRRRSDTFPSPFLVLPFSLLLLLFLPILMAFGEQH